jgi:hypothetical protein
LALPRSLAQIREIVPCRLESSLSLSEIKSEFFERGHCRRVPAEAKD